MTELLIAVLILNTFSVRVVSRFLHVTVLHYYYYYRFTALWILSGTTRVSRYQKGKTRKVNIPIWIYCSKRR